LLFGLIVLGVFAFFAQVVSTLALQSPTFDEEFHLARAYAYVRTGDLRMQQNHPPLVSVLAGLPLLLMPELTPPAQIPHWDDAFLFEFADSLCWRLGHDVDKMLFLARFSIVVVGTLLGACVCRWAREAHGWRSALLAAGLYAAAPNLLAHSGLVTTDLAVTAASFGALFLFWRYLRRPRPRRMLAAGLAVGLALTAKLSGLFVLPVIGLLALWDGRRQPPLPLPEGTRHARPGGWRRWLATWRLAALRVAPVVLVAGLVVWATYHFELRPWPGSALPLPAVTYLLNLRTLVGHAERGHGAFLMGRVSMHGWWYYFPVTFLLKTPLPLLALLGLAAWDSVRRRRFGVEAAWLLFPLGYFAFALASSLNIGYRYILPLDPFLVLYVAKLAEPDSIWCARWRPLVLPLLVVGSLGTMLWLHPHYLAYFNLLAGGPAGGYRYLVDSNLDWGQDLKHLKAYLDGAGVDEVWLGYFGTADPAYYGLRYRSLFSADSSRLAEGFTPLDPAPGWYAISATVLQGTYWPEPDIFDWFRRQQPVRQVGYSIFVYRVEPDPDPPAWLGLCYTPAPPLSEAEAARRLGRDNLRVVGFDCGQAWVYPAGDKPGWYLVPLAQDGRGTLAGEALGSAPIVYRERGLRAVPGYTLYRWEPGHAAPVQMHVHQAWASATLAPMEAESLTPLEVPAELAGEVAFLGYALSASRITPGAELVLTTLWQVHRHPSDPALSLFAHVVSPAGTLGVGDGLGFPAVQWLPGDIFLQRNRIPIAEEAQPGRAWVQVGMYSLASGNRLPVFQGQQPVADRLLLTPIMVGDGQ